MNEKKDLIIAGIDEAGRGCLAGPVVAASVILPKYYSLPGLRDSKKNFSQKETYFRKANKRDRHIVGYWTCNPKGN